MYHRPYYAHLIRRQLQAADMPEIAIFLDVDRMHTRPYGDTIMCIKNIGTGVAHDLKFSANQSFEIVPAFMYIGIKYLEPGRKITYQLKRKGRSSFPISVTYRDSTQRRYDRSFYLNTLELDHTVSGDELRRIANSLSEIKSVIDNISR